MPIQTEEFKNAQNKIANRLKENRPNITDATVRTYTSLLSNMYYREYPRTEPIDLSFFTNEKHIIAILDNKPPSTRKTYLAAIVVLNGQDHPVQNIERQMKEDSLESDKIASMQNMNDKQKENWIDYSGVKDLQQAYEIKALKILNNKNHLTEPEHELITRYMILTLASGMYFPPRRSEMVYIVVDNPDIITDNYIDMKTNEFVYNRYKTARTYGQQRVSYPTQFKSILMKYLAKIKGQKYLIEKNGKPYTANYLTRELNAIFGKNISTSMLRHIYVTTIYKDMPTLNTMKQTASNMGHNLKQSLEYIKR